MIEKIENITKYLADEYTAFIAVPQNSLADDSVRLLYHNCLKNEDLQPYFNGIDHVEIEGEEFEFAGATNVSHEEMHFVERVPVYAVENPRLGLDFISRDEGHTNLREFVKTDQEPARSGSDTVDIQTLVRELADHGAEVVALNVNWFKWTGRELFALVVYMGPATGAEVVRDYNAVNVDGNVFDLHCKFVLDKSEYYNKLPVYIAEGVLRLDPVSTEEGLANFRRFQNATGKQQT